MSQSSNWPWAGREEDRATISPKRKGCGNCELSCTLDAIKVIDGKAVVTEELCSSCALCLSRCRPGALLWATPAVDGGRPPT